MGIDPKEEHNAGNEMQQCLQSGAALQIGFA
jgi:hypothetical protein